MKFASTRQIIAMVLISAALLYALDYWRNPQLWHKQGARSTVSHGHEDEAELTFWMSGGCSLDDVRQALAGLPGLDLANAKAPARSVADSGNPIVIPITELAKVDFAALDRVLRQNGFAAARMELGGVKHFGLQAEFPHLPSQLTDRAVEEGIGFLKAQSMGEHLQWLDSLDMNTQSRVLMAYARYVAPGKTVNVAELVAGLNQMGLVPNSLHVVIGERSSGDQTGQRQQ